MTTPTSSVTTPSPPMAYLQASPIAPPSDAGDLPDAAEREERQRAVQKFLARAEISKLTRGLRARLSYATYKATHNVSNVALDVLEAHAQAESPFGARGLSAKSTYYDNSPVQGSSSTMSTSAGPPQRRGSMAPPTAIPSSSRTHHAQPNGKEGSSANPSQSLYASILAPPPAKRARTIHNPEDPHVPAPPKMTNGTPKARRGSHPTQSSRTAHSRTGSGTQIFSSIAESTRAQARHRHEEPARGKGSSRRDKGKSRRRGANVPDVGATDARDAELDMKAAATLTSLLRNSRSSITVGTASPRSSISAGSDVGSSQSIAQYAQSSTRTTTAPSSLVPSAESSFAIPNARPTTPTMGGRSIGAGDGNTTPKMGHQVAGGGNGTTPATATDQEAINLLYFLHESPSPARPSTTRSKDAHDAAAFRALGGGAELHAKGRVLFPAAGGGGGTPDGALAQRMLARDNSGSFSSVSTVLSESPARNQVPGGTLIRGGSSDPFVAKNQSQNQNMLPEAAGAARLAEPPKMMVTPSTPTDVRPPELLPPPVSPSPRPAQVQRRPPSPPPPAESKPMLAPPTTPGTFTFNLNDFINVSPSPAAATTRTPGLAMQGLTSGLRADMGRKLFEEEQGEPMGGVQEQQQVVQGGGTGGGGALGAGIHLAHF
ncbi:hypothetical protein DENSPDRAFT_861447 [Dentipellis sp. KUC8613]|nr:hypothetical protein DENSPDRAFT_861447 [Dentipellis sp. KUC8613]